MHRSFGMLLGVLAVSSAASAQLHHKLNAPLVAPGNVVGDVRDAQLSPDGAWAVYVADQARADARELHSVALDGSAAAVRISAAFEPGREVTHFEISPDSRWVVYRADQDQPSLRELYAAPIDGSRPPVKLNLPVVPNDDVGPVIRVTETGLALFEARQRLYAAPLDGSSPATDVGGPMGPGGFVLDFAAAPGGRRVVFTARLAGDQPMELFSASLTGLGRPRALPEARPRRVRLSTGSITSGFRISPDARRVVFQESGSERRLFSVPIGGGTPADLSGKIVAGGRVHFGGFEISADSSRVVFRAEKDVPGTSELYSVPIDAFAGPLQLNRPLVPGGDVHSFEIAADSSRVVYLADQDTDNRPELFSVPLDGAAPAVKILAVQQNEGFVFTPFRISPDSRRVVSLTSTRHADRHVFALRSVPLAGGEPPVLLNGPHVEIHEEEGEELQVYEYRISSDGRRVVYLTDEDRVDTFELYSAPLDVRPGPARALRMPPLGPVRLNRPLERGDVGDSEDTAFTFDISADGTRVVYRATQDDPSVFELYRVPIDRSQGPVKLNPTLAIGPMPGDVDAFEVSSDSLRVVYRADAETDGVSELFSVPGDAGAPAVKLSDPGLHGSVREFTLAPDVARVAYVAGVDGSVALFGTALDGQGGPVELSGELSPGEDVQAFEIAPAGGRVVYLADQEGQNLQELFSAPLDGSAPAVQLNPPLVPLGGVTWCNTELVHFTPDGARVVYRADQEVDEVYELFSVPTDASAPAVKLNAPLVAGGDVSCALISADGSRVVYPADQETDGVFELFSVPVDGSAAPVKLNAPFTAERQASEVRIGPDGARVVYLADQALNGLFELYSVPGDGSAAPVKLNPALVGGGDVLSDFAFSAGGARVVYRADQERNDRTDLYSVPADGSQPAVRLSPSLASDRDVDAFAISPDGARVVFRANPNVREVWELFSVPIDGSAPAVQLNRPPVAGGFVSSFEIQPGSTHVVYAARQDDAAIELFRVPIGGGTARRISAALVAGGNVVNLGPQSFRSSPDGRLVVYRADLEVDERVELFGTLVVHGPLPARSR